MLVSLLCDVIPFAVMAFIPFENVRALGIVTALGLLSLTVDEFLMMIPALSSITITELKSAGARVKTEKVGTFDRFLAASVRELISNRSTAAAVIAGFVLITFGLGLVVAKAPVGQNNTFAIHNYLTHSWNRSNIYQMEKEITTRFGGVYPMIVLVEAKQEHDKVLETPAVLRAVDSLADYMRSLPHVGTVSDLAFPLKLRHQFVNGDDPKYFMVPKHINLSAKQSWACRTKSPAFLTGCSARIIARPLSSHMSVTPILGVVSRPDGRVLPVKRILCSPDSPVRVSVAGGAVGIAQAFNRNIRYWLIVSVVLGLAGTALLAIPGYRIGVAGFAVAACRWQWDRS